MISGRPSSDRTASKKRSGITYPSPKTVEDWGD